MENKSKSLPNSKTLKNYYTQQIRSDENEDIRKPAAYRITQSFSGQTSAQVAETQKNGSSTDDFGKELREVERRIARNFLQAGNDDDKDLICSIFNHLQELCDSPEFELIHEDMNTCFPNLKEEIQQGKADFSRKDLCVIIAGETGAGKSTLINHLVDKKIFKPSTRESTATICRIRNSGNENEIICKVFGPNNQVLEEKTFHEESVDSVMEYLHEYVDNTGKRYSKNIDHVDVNLSVPILKENTMIVDTPGIGRTSDREEKMMNYLPNATSFVFVMNVGSAGGVQKDRLLKIIQEIMKLHDEKEIPCFDPQDALFVSNKWDSIPKNECQETWEGL